MTKQTVYTEEVTARMVEAYTSAPSDESRDEVVKSFADELSVPAASVRAKLVSEKVYVAKVRKAKDGAPVESKASIVRDIAQALDVSEEVVESLEKATKPVLKMVRSALTD